MQTLAANYRTSKVRRVTLNGRDYYVAPLTLIVPGVLNGSRGALLYPPEEIRRNFLAWNHIPLVVNHPVDPKTGEHVSALDPAVLARQGVGHVFKPYVTGDGRLKAEGWFDVEHTRRVEPRILDALEAGRQIELSTGLYTTNDQAPLFASFLGRPYQFVARDYRPDHLAILPDHVGACSLRDGCGVLVNSAGGTPPAGYRLVVNTGPQYPEKCPYCGTAHEIDPDSGVCNRCGESVAPLPRGKSAKAGKPGKKPVENDKAGACGCGRGGKSKAQCSCRHDPLIDNSGWTPVAPAGRA